MHVIDKKTADKRVACRPVKLRDLTESARAEQKQRFEDHLRHYRPELLEADPEAAKLQRELVATQGKIESLKVVLIELGRQLVAAGEPDLSAPETFTVESFITAGQSAAPAALTRIALNDSISRAEAARSKAEAHRASLEVQIQSAHDARKAAIRAEYIEYAPSQIQAASAALAVLMGTLVDEHNYMATTSVDREVRLPHAMLDGVALSVAGWRDIVQFAREGR
ncbi:hypothetical protein [Gloeobacter violaceus]|uniref:Glr3894 protein n=1 Tax=Gloeobacter violaceus (strain ATCC 29082 / PCC 7421) TaxID=251221 RepID=Q7NEI5_GLOVI|nr:hypothetical protein [Gloeobacter violaceus]BAC91835.1 glr3894 [Gloeobacter violaceus PCC 7421]